MAAWQSDYSTVFFTDTLPRRRKWERDMVITREYPGSLTNFQARMGRFIALNVGGWVSSDLETQVIISPVDTCPGEAEWLVEPVVTLVDGEPQNVRAGALIIASEMQLGRVTVDFLDPLIDYPIPEDRYQAIKPTLGPFLEELAGAIFEGCEPATTGAPATQAVELHPTPPPPEAGSPIDKWLDYYHAIRESGSKFTFKDLAKLCDFSSDYLKHCHGDYKRNRGIP